MRPQGITRAIPLQQASFLSVQRPTIKASWLFDLSTLIILLDCQPGDRVLDIGAGSGFSSEMLARLGYDVVAIDPDRHALVNNRRRPTFDRARIDGEVRVTQAVAERLPFGDASFDGAVGMNVLHHVAQLQAAVSELARVLKPGAHAVFCEPVLDHLASSEAKRAMQEHGENDQPFDVVALLNLALGLDFSDAMLTATLQPPLSLLPVQELELYLSGHHPRRWLTPAGIIEELHRRHAYAVIVRRGMKPKTSRYPGELRCVLAVSGLPSTATAGKTFNVRVEALNTGDTLWLATPNRLGGFVTFGCKRAGATLSIPLPASLPPGSYRLAFDLVDESVCWFSDRHPDSKVVSALAVE
jgi:SAM-dependent methyltransferase